VQNFIVLGQIPGTHLDITFGLWLLGAASILGLSGVIFLYRLHVLRRWLIAIAWVRLIRQVQQV
jgi:hypothetical protein